MTQNNTLDGWAFESHYRGGRRLRQQRLPTALLIQNYDLDDSRFIKTFYLAPYTNYIATVHVVADNIKVQEGPQHSHIGVNLCIMDSWTHTTEFDNGINNGEHFEGDLTLHFQTNDNPNLKLGLRLGFWCSEATGSVTFQNFKLEEDDSRLVLGTDQIRLNIALDELQDAPEILNHYEKFLKRMELAYNSMSELYNKYPFDHKVVFYETRSGIGAWAYAGNPIVWNNKCCVGYFRDLENKNEELKEKFSQLKKQQLSNSPSQPSNSNSQPNSFQIYPSQPTPMPNPESTNINANLADEIFFDDACFGTIHEMGHNFDMSGLWRINHENGANFNLCYAVEANDFPIYFDNELTRGRGLQDGFYKRVYERTIGNVQERKYSHDGLLYCILRIKDSIGWGPFKQVFSKYAQKNPPKELSSQQVLKLMLDELSQVSGFDVKKTFPPGELEFIFSQERY